MGKPLQRRVSPEGVVQSAFRTFFRRGVKGEYPVDHSGSFWHLLVRITMNKVRRQREHHGAAKRDLAAEVYFEDGAAGPEAVARDPSPEEAALWLDEFEALFDGLEDPEPEMLRLRLEGYSSAEIAARVGCSRWTVRRVLDRVGRILNERLKQESGNRLGLLAPATPLFRLYR